LRLLRGNTWKPSDSWRKTWLVVLPTVLKLYPTPKWSLEDFLKHQPAKFDGKTNPDLADQWMKDMERIFDAKRFPDESLLAYIVYMLTRKAEH